MQACRKDTVHEEITSPFVELSRTDFVANIFFLVPAGFLAAGMLLVDKGSRWGVLEAWAVVACLASLFAAVVELAQLFVPSRTFTVSDGVAQTVGANAGVALWILFGPTLHQRLQVFGAARRADRYAQRGVELAFGTRRHWYWAATIAWLVIIALQHWAPFNFQRDPQFVCYRLSSMSFVPFENYYYSPLPVAAAEIVHKLTVGIPLGLFLALGGRRSAMSSRASLPAFRAIVPTAATLTVIEAIQLLVPSRIPDPTDVLLQTCGAFLGGSVVSVLSVFRRRNITSPIRSFRDDRHRRRLQGRRL
jgi:VanZ family protein